MPEHDFSVFHTDKIFDFPIVAYSLRTLKQNYVYTFSVHIKSTWLQESSETITSFDPDC